MTEPAALPRSLAAVVFDAILNRTPPPIVSVNPEVPLELERIVDKAIEKDRMLRYQHAAKDRDKVIAQALSNLATKDL